MHKQHVHSYFKECKEENKYLIQNFLLIQRNGDISSSYPLHLPKCFLQKISSFKVLWLVQCLLSSTFKLSDLKFESESFHKKTVLDHNIFSWDNQWGIAHALPKHRYKKYWRNRDKLLWYLQLIIYLANPIWNTIRTKISVIKLPLLTKIYHPRHGWHF